jgi:pimeloyl-ACP methyl ester carboxylesterase
VLLIGHSLGATIAVRAAELDARRIAGLVLVAPPVTQSSLVAIDRFLAARFVGQLMSAFIAGASLGPRHRDRFARTRRSFLAEQRHLFGELRVVEAQLTAVGCPTTVVAGLRDRVVPLVAMVHAVERLPNAEMVVLPEVGHDIPRVAPVSLAFVIRRSIHELSGSPELRCTGLSRIFSGGICSLLCIPKSRSLYYTYYVVRSSERWASGQRGPEKDSSLIGLVTR